MRAATGQAPIHSFRVAVDRVATTIFCLAALSLGWWLGARSPEDPAPVTRTETASGGHFLCNSDSDCEAAEDAYETYLDTEKARARAWRHGGP